MIDEKFVNGDRHKERWSIEEGWSAVEDTVNAAKYLSSQRLRIQKECSTSHRLVLSCQGVDAGQYLTCLDRILAIAHPEDVIGLGGWCILGKQPRWLNTFWETIEKAIPAIAEAEIESVHIFGVTWWKRRPGFSYTPLGSLLWLCDKYGIKLTTDGRSPIGNALWKKNRDGTTGTKRAGSIHPYWRWNLAAIRTILGCLRDRPEYQPLPSKQLLLF